MTELVETAQVDFTQHATGGIEFMRWEEWFDYLHRTTSGSLFPLKGTLNDFLKRHRDELIDMGAIVYRGGRGSTLVRRDFGKFALRILMRSRRETPSCPPENAAPASAPAPAAAPAFEDGWVAPNGVAA
jgi:hypothetical protein